MTQSEELFARARRLIPGGVNSPVRAFKAVGGTPLFIRKAEGARLWDADGKGYIDYVGSWGPMILGHAWPPVVEAIAEAARARHLLRRALRARGRAGRARGAHGALHREGPLRLLRHRGHDERAPARPRVHRPPEDPEVRRLLPRPRRRPARRGAARASRPSASPARAGVPEGTVADTLVAPYNDLAAVERGDRRARRRPRGGDRRAGGRQHGLRRPARRLPRRPARPARARRARC